MEIYIVADFTYVAVDGELSANASLQCGTRGAQRNAIGDTTDPRLLLKWPFSGHSTHHWFQSSKLKKKDEVTTYFIIAGGQPFAGLASFTPSSKTQLNVRFREDFE